VTAILLLALAAQSASPDPKAFFERHCLECHGPEEKKGGLDLSTVKRDLSRPEDFARWVKILDRIGSGEMPPKKQPRPPAADVQALTASLDRWLLAADRARLAAGSRTDLRRMTRSEYENTVRDLLELDGIPLQSGLPADGSVHGFDKNSEALDLSHVNLAKYLEAADAALDMAIATQPEAPIVRSQHISLAKHVGHILGNGDAVLLKGHEWDPEYPPAGDQGHLDQGAHERMGSFSRGSTVGVFRHEDESFKPYFLDFATLYPGRYRIKVSFWSFQWDKGKVLPSRGTEAARLSIVQLSEDGRGGGHPSYVLGYYDAPSLTPRIHDMTVWLNFKDAIGFNTASLAPVANYNRKGRSLAFTGPGIACDWLDIEGPLYEVWPPPGHRLLFSDLPIREFKAADRPGVRPPGRHVLKQEIVHVTNRPDPPKGVWTVESADPTADADRLLAGFLPKAFRRPVDPGVRAQYAAKVGERLRAGDSFEAAMRWAYRAALCSPDFLYHVEPAGALDDPALACRVSYFLWNSMPDGRLTRAAASGRLRDPKTLAQEVERLLADPRSDRFIENFLGQWMRLRSIAANDPDPKLYPEFSPYLQDSMVAETRAYFRELVSKNLGASYLVQSDFAMLNEKLAVHYGIPGVSGSEIRRVPLPPGCPRGPFLTQAAILKITANGTTTSPVPRGAFVMARLLGQPPEPPPATVPAVEPDVRGATTIREQLDKHRSNATCAACHAKIDPPGFALESFDVIGGERQRYRSIGAGDPAPRGSIDPRIGIGFKLGPPVDPSGALPDGRRFGGIADLQSILAADAPRLLRALAEQLLRYAVGRDLAYSDRAEVTVILERTRGQGGGIRTLVHEIVQSRLFQTH
jgi:mono/diheme cytochrome c family protein